jgi:hypothetical protein
MFALILSCINPNTQSNQGFHLSGFFIPIFDRRDGRSPTVASRGNPYYGKDAEIGKEVARIVPLR